MGLFFTHKLMFCLNCENMVIVEKQSNINFLTCLSCPYLQEIKSKIVRRFPNKTKKVDQIHGGKNELKYASVCSKKCIKCLSETAMFMELQTRSADEPMTIFYECVDCRVTWKE